VGISPDGTKVFVTGSSVGSQGDTDYATVAYDAATGAQLWVGRYDGPANGGDGAEALAVSPDGSKLFVTGGSEGVGTGGDYATVAYDAATGGQLWVSRYDGANDGDGAIAVGVSPDGTNVIVTGTTYFYGGRTIATVAYDAATGGQLWVAYGPGSGWSTSAAALAVGPDGSKVFMTGTGANGYWTNAYDAHSGAHLWTEHTHYKDSASALGVSPDGSQVFVTGRGHLRTGAYDELTVAYDAASGARLWAKRYGGNADVGADLGVSPDGSKLFVTGQTAGSLGDTDYSTIAYAATGARLWVKRYDGPGQAADGATTLGVSPDGSKVFVTGQSTGSGTGLDYATVAYSTG
jgi:PQQ-like domain